MLRNTVLLFPGPGAHRGKYATVLELSRRGVHRGRGTRGKRGRTGLPTSCSAPSPLGRIIRHSFDTRISFDQGAARLATS